MKHRRQLTTIKTHRWRMEPCCQPTRLDFGTGWKLDVSFIRDSVAEVLKPRRTEGEHPSGWHRALMYKSKSGFFNTAQKVFIRIQTCWTLRFPLFHFRLCFQPFMSVFLSFSNLSHSKTILYACCIRTLKFQGFGKPYLLCGLLVAYLFQKCILISHSPRLELLCNPTGPLRYPCVSIYFQCSVFMA